MTEVEISGVGIWSEFFSNWEEFCSAINGEEVAAQSPLKPEVIAPNERRRAPQSVKMAVEVMDQACRMAAVDPATVATVFASGIGDMQITDYMCRTLATAPLTMSPTRFHNSVHNAATGYWSIATGSHCPANAISAYEGSVSMALLEGALQSLEEQIPVLVAAQEVSAPTPFSPIYPFEHPLAVALLLTPPGLTEAPLASVGVQFSGESADSPAASDAPAELSANYTAAALPLLEVIARRAEAQLKMSTSGSHSLAVTVAPGCRSTR